MATKEQTEKALDNVEKDPTKGASVQTGGKTSQDDGVKAVVNPERGDVASVVFPDGEGGADVYKAGQTHTVPAALLEVKDPFGVAYLAEPKKSE